MMQTSSLRGLRGSRADLEPGTKSYKPSRSEIRLRARALLHLRASDPGLRYVLRLILLMVGP